MKRLFLMAGIGLGALLVGNVAQATPITGEISFAGVSKINNANTEIGFPTLFGFSLTGIGTATGDFAPIAPCVGCATMHSITFSPSLVTGLVYSATNHGLTTTFTSTDLVSADVTNVGFGLRTLSLVLGGDMTLTGFDATHGYLALTANQWGHVAGTYSLTAIDPPVPAPEPMALALLGTGLLGIGAARYRFKRV